MLFGIKKQCHFSFEENINGVNTWNTVRQIEPSEKKMYFWPHKEGSGEN